MKEYKNYKPHFSGRVKDKRAAGLLIPASIVNVNADFPWKMNKPLRCDCSDRKKCERFFENKKMRRNFQKETEKIIQQYSFSE